MLKRISALLTVLLLLPTIGARAAAAEDESFYAGRSWDDLVEQVLTESYADAQTAALGYYNTVTGEEHYFNGDDYFFGASLYKLPLNMYCSEQITKGERDWSTETYGTSYEEIQVSSLTYSNNPHSLDLVNELGGWTNFRTRIAPYMDEVSTDEDFTHRTTDFTARQMTRCAALLAAESDRFPRVIDCLMDSAPDLFLEYADVPYPIAQKYANNFNEGNVFHAAGIVYTDDPIVLVVLTRNLAAQHTIMSRYCELMCGYTQYQRTLRLEAEAERAEQERLAAEEAAREAKEQAAAQKAAEEEAARLVKEAEEARLAELREQQKTVMAAEDSAPIIRALLPLAAALVLLLIALIAGRSPLLALTLALSVAAITLLSGQLQLPQSSRTGRTQGISPGVAVSQLMNERRQESLADLAHIEKVWRIPESSTVAPKPDPNAFGTAESFEELRSVLEAAEELLDGQELVLTADTVLAPDTPIRYYRDESILVLVWREYIGNRLCTFSEVKLADASQLRRKLSENKYGSSIQLYPTELARECNAVAAIDGDFYIYQNTGIHVYQREVYAWNGKDLDTCFFDSKGDMIFVRSGELDGKEAVEAFVAENDILFSVSFGPVIVENGVNVADPYYYMGRSRDVHARSCMGQMGELHYLMMTVYIGCVTKDAADMMVAKGCPRAYCMDGGQSAAIIFNNEQVNFTEYNAQRPLSDIVYFATAIPYEDG